MTNATGKIYCRSCGAFVQLHHADYVEAGACPGCGYHGPQKVAAMAPAAVVLAKKKDRQRNQAARRREGAS